jgi:O-antigen/teichoic acid export membrane protein
MSREIIQFGVTIVLARLLSPNDYGLVGMSGTVLGFVQIFNTFGFRSAIIQKKEITDSHYSTAFWMTLAISTILYLITLLASPLAAIFFKEPKLVGIMAVSALGFIITSLSTIQLAMLEKQLDFKKITIIELATAVTNGIVSISLALSGHGVWSLVWGSVAGQSVAIPLTWFLIRWTPALKFDRAAFNDLFTFGAHLTGATLVNYFARNADNLIIGRVLGSGALGYYALAYNLMLKPLQYVSSNLARVLFPALSAIRDDKEKTRQTYLKVVQAISILTFPMMTGLLFLAPDLIHAVYGAKWMPVVPIFQILCLLGAIQSIGTTVGIIYISQGRADLQLKYTLIFSPIIVASFFVGVQWGTVGVASAYLMSSGSIWIWSHVVANRLIGLRLAPLFKRMAPATMASIGMYLVLNAAKYFPFEFAFAPIAVYAKLASLIVTGAISYTILLYLIKGDDFMAMLKAYKS